MNPDEIYQVYRNRRVVQMPVDLLNGHDLDRVLEKFEELTRFEATVREEAVIGVWGYKGPYDKPKGFGLHTRRQYDRIITAQSANKIGRIYLAPRCFDRTWFERRLQRLQPAHSKD